MKSQMRKSQGKNYQFVDIDCETYNLFLNFSHSDWIGLFKESFTSLEDYHGYTWASKSKDQVKKVWMTDSIINVPGKFVLIYFSSKNSVLGMSEPFDITAQGSKPQQSIEVAIEAHEHHD